LKTSNIIAILLAFTFHLSLSAFAQQSNPDTSGSGLYRVGITYGSSLFPQTEEYQFKLSTGETIVLNKANHTAYFSRKFKTGETYTLSQLSGPRTCSFFDQEKGTIANRDIVITASCGNPQFAIYKANYRGIESGEIFKFADDYGRIYQIPFSATNMNLGGYPVGDTFTFKQTAGPRPCIITPATGIVTATPVIVDCDCRKKLKEGPPPTPPAMTHDLVTRSSDDKLLNTYYESWTPVIGGTGEDEGRYVAFAMYGKGIDGSSGNYRQIFWRDRKLGITKLVSKAADGKEGDGNSALPAISADGKTVAFESYAKNLFNGDMNSGRDVFVWNVTTGNLKLVSKGIDGSTANAESTEPVLSGNGSVVAYTSNASNIVKLEPVFNTPNVYVYNVSSGTTEFITKDYETGKAAGGYAPAISDDGTRIAFCAFTNRLTANDNNNLWDIFLWQNGKQELKRISMTETGAERNQGDESSSRVVYPAISGNGKYIAFATTSTNIVSDDNNQVQDIFLYNIETSAIKRVSRANNSVEGDGHSPFSQGDRIGISYYGNWIAYNTAATNLGVPKGNIVIQNTESGKIIPITQLTIGSTARPMLSRYGNYIVAGCSEPYDKRFSSSGIFTIFTNAGVCNTCED
jgi:Tol biopolymer transport system component